VLVKVLYEDLPRHGLALVPPSSAEYDDLLTDIARRVNAPPEGSPPIPERFRPRIDPAERPLSAILLNRSAKAIAGLQMVWRFETETGRTFDHSQGMLFARTLLLPFYCQSEAQTKLYTYWQTIFPGSKRYVAESGLVGDNTDVRPPADEEKWKGGIAMGGGRGGGSNPEPIRQVTLALDGAFFLDGEFVGPDAQRVFDRTLAEVEAHRMVARIAKSAHDRGATPTEILSEIDKVTGAAPDRPPMPPNFRNRAATVEDFQKAALQTLAFQFAAPRRFGQAGSEDQLVFSILAWNDAVLPNYRKSP
jgi:hypothetical protein